MTDRERQNKTLNFEKVDRGAVRETFYPWDKTIDRWYNEGLPKQTLARSSGLSTEKYYNTVLAEGCCEYEASLGFDKVKRIFFNPPFSCFERKLLEETDEYAIWQEKSGIVKKHFKNSTIIEEIKHPITCEADWELLKAKMDEEKEKYYKDEQIKEAFLYLKEGHDKGDYTIMLSISGFFWSPRDMFGIENHLYAFYDYPEMMHDINEYILNFHLDRLAFLLDVIAVDTIYISEDLSGKTGPMLSKEHFDEFVGAYYKRLVPMLKEKGVNHVLVDTDGDFKVLIPNFISSGIEGFVPMDVNAGMDIVAVRESFPTVKFIGAFNKLCIAEGKEAIDNEFKRILPVIKQGGYIPGCDHQVAPSTSFENYKYYINALTNAMKHCGEDL